LIDKLKFFVHFIVTVNGIYVVTEVVSSLTVTNIGKTPVLSQSVS
jgi:hypothetical protein